MYFKLNLIHEITATDGRRESTEMELNAVSLLPLQEAGDKIKDVCFML